MLANNKTCETCQFYFLKEETKTVGFFKKRTITTSKPICLKFGVHGIDAYVARLRINLHISTDVSGLGHDSYELIDGPCGSEGKFWESKD